MKASLVFDQNTNTINLEVGKAIKVQFKNEHEYCFLLDKKGIVEIITHGSKEFETLEEFKSNTFKENFAIIGNTQVIVPYIDTITGFVMNTGNFK